MITIIKGPKGSGKTTLIHRTSLMLTGEYAKHITQGFDVSKAIIFKGEVLWIDVEFFHGLWMQLARNLSVKGAHVFVEVRDVEFTSADTDMPMFTLEPLSTYHPQGDLL